MMSTSSPAHAASGPDGAGQITIEELFTYVRPRVTREAKLDHRDQTPTLVVGKGVVAKDVAVAWNVSR